MADQAEAEAVEAAEAQEAGRLLIMRKQKKIRVIIIKTSDNWL